MATKRTITEVDAESAPSPSQADGKPGPAFKKRKPLGKGKHKANQGTSEHSKKRARAIERLISKNSDLPANVRNDLERELAAHRATIADKAFQKLRSSMITKYHKARFLERKKAMRRIKTLRRKVEENSDPNQTETLEQELHVAEVDEAYTLNFPHAEPYVSLYEYVMPTNAAEGEASTPKAELKAEKPPLWSTIEKALQDGPHALRNIRERRPADLAGTAPPKARPAKEPSAPRAAPKKQPDQHPRTQGAADAQRNGKQPLNRRERRRLLHQAGATAGESDDDEGGFFEEP
ncbi:hypothetical protein S7711_00331 [Stachybotrys chartarum IBT 7711]|uniref:rRNA-processing protein EFG1 n=1 Tax=Stachybotrys chartarum (strain CBS 109288 / IBT 7711) TaxID=1280523 RepID=A0A084B9E2_STACB|nr:hypothetical protein S7711_00331 [Stachybotrys chartarum IBT 7711]KFA55530.1 hypothetical protein S40293_02052 [Stachybotrys chartarum IBT 40293]